MGVIDYAWGQCTWFVAHSLSWLSVTSVGALGNAKDWIANARARGLGISQSPVVGSAVVYNGSYPGSEGYGHVGVVTAVNPNGTFQFASDNWGGVGKTHIGTSTMAYVEGFILPPSQQAGVAGAQQAMSMAGGNPGSVVAGGTYAGNASTRTTDVTIPNPVAMLGNWSIDVVERVALGVLGIMIIAIGLYVFAARGGEKLQTVVLGEDKTDNKSEEGESEEGESEEGEEHHAASVMAEK